MLIQAGKSKEQDEKRGLIICRYAPYGRDLV
jgi:hypothetical protein